MQILQMSEPEVTPKLIKEPIGPPELEALLETIFDWNFDIFKLEAITDGR